MSVNSLQRIILAHYYGYKVNYEIETEELASK